jgi:uncharacterized membrane protein
MKREVRMKGSMIAAAALALAACQAQEAPPVAAPSNQVAAGNAAALPSEAVPPEPEASAGVPDSPSAAAGSTVQGPQSPAGYRIIGTEPFWGGTVTATEIVYSTPDNQQGERIAVTAAYGPDSEVYRGTLGGKPFVLRLTAGPCSDGMSDNVHEFTAVLEVQGETRQGCANAQSR